MNVTSDAPGSPVSPLNAFQGTVTPSGLSWMYRAGLAAVAFAMVLLPAVYIALIVFAGWGVFWHATENIWIISSARGRSGVFNLIAYAVPIVAGITLVLFMVKPFFAKRAKPRLTLPLERADEPLLFEFVDRVCSLVGAPAPARIEVNCDVNASASFRKGFFSFVGNDLVLTIGLPLVAGLNMRQFAGVLAHEFGHFAQGAGMRLTYVIRQVNAWFARVVYERDQWDLKLEQTAKSIDLRVGIVLHAARGAVWLTRKILWALMHLGHGISCFMLRQMEFDADSYECKVSGSDTFAETTVRLQTLGVASQQAFGDLSESWRNGRLPDNFAAFVQHKAAAFAPELRCQIQEDLGKRKTGAFDTHPSDADRVKAAQALDAPGVFRLQDAAANLFANFPELSKSATRSFYEKQHELALTDQSLVSTEESVKESLANEQQQQTLQRYYFGVNMAAVSFQIDAAGHLPLPDWQASCAALIAARQKAGELREVMQASLKEHEETEARWIRHFNVCSLRQANFALEAKDFSIESTYIPDLEKALPEIAGELARIESTLRPFSAAVAARLAAALRLLHHDGLAFDAAPSLRLESAALLEVLLGLSDILPDLHEIRRRFGAFELLLQNRGNHQEPATVDGAMRPIVKALQSHLDAIHSRLKEIRYPFPHASGGITVSQYARTNGEYEHQIEAAFVESQAAMDRLYSLYYKVVGRLAAIAESVEQRVENLPQG